MRNPWLDELRGLAICAVFVSHGALVFREDSEFARALLVPALGVGVDLFFVISGYLIVGRAASAVVKAKTFWLGAAAFWLGRLVRIGVPAWATIAVLYVAGRLGAVEGLRLGDLTSGAGFVANFYWAPCFAGREGCGDPLLSSHFWSLACEMQFYALAPFLAALGRRSVWIVALAVLATGAVMSRPWGGFWWTFRPDALVVGVLVGLDTRWRAPWIARIPPVGMSLATFWILVAAVLARVLSIAGTGVGLVVVAAIFGMVVAGNRRAGDDGEGRGPAVALRWIGERSFSIYLVHLPILSGVRAAFHDHAPVGVVMMLATLAAVLAALCLEGFVTRPSMVLGRRLAARLCEFRAGKMKPRMEGSNG